MRSSAANPLILQQAELVRPVGLVRAGRAGTAFTICGECWPICAVVRSLLDEALQRARSSLNLSCTSRQSNRRTTADLDRQSAEILNLPRAREPPSLSEH